MKGSDKGANDQNLFQTSLDVPISSDEAMNQKISQLTAQNKYLHDEFFINKSN